MPNWGPLREQRLETGDPVVVVIRLEGALNGAAECFAFLDRIQDDVRRRGMRMVVNLAEVAYLGSSGVGILASLYLSVTGKGGRICLAGVEGRNKTILKEVHLLDLIPHAATEEDAVRSVSV
jgi:anti-anti-sigma factor